MIKVEINAQSLINRLLKVRKRWETEALPEIQTEWQQEVDKQYIEKQNTWAAWSRNYARFREREGVKGNFLPLNKLSLTGQMISDYKLGIRFDNHSIEIPYPTKGTAQGELPLAQIHQEGLEKSNIPSRKFDRNEFIERAKSVLKKYTNI